MAYNPIKKLAGDTAVYGLGTVVPRLLNYLLVPFYTIMVFNKSQYGQITELYAYVAILLVMLTYGMETAFFRYANKDKNPLKVFHTAATSLLISSTLFILFILFFRNDIAGWIQYSGHSEYILLLGLVVALDAFTAIPFAHLRFLNKAKRFSFIKIANVVVNIFFNFLFLIIIPRLFKESYNEFWLYRQIPLVGFVFLSNLIASLFTLFMLFPELRNYKPRIDNSMLKKMLAYGLPILVIGFAGMINEVSDKILLRYLLPGNTNINAVIGVYGANYKLAILMVLFIQMFRYAAEPFFFAESAKKEAKETYANVMSVFVAFGWFIFLLVLLFIDVFKYFIGPAFWGGLIIVPIILAAKLFLGIFYNLSVWYKLTDRTLYGSLIAIMGAVITIVLNVILIPKYSYIGSAWANLACYFSMALVSWLMSRKYYKVDYNLKRIIFYSALALILYFVSRILPLTSVVQRLTTGAVLMLIYLSVTITIEKKQFRKVPNIP